MRETKSELIHLPYGQAVRIFRLAEPKSGVPGEPVASIAISEHGRLRVVNNVDKQDGLDAPPEFNPGKGSTWSVPSSDGTRTIAIYFENISDVNKMLKFRCAPGFEAGAPVPAESTDLF